MKNLVLAGAGHAHLHILKSFAQKPWDGVQVTLIAPYARQIYSGMLPGWISGHYHLDQCAALLAPLLRSAQVTFIQDQVTGIDANTSRIHTATRGTFDYDTLSINLGARLNDAALIKTSVPLLSIRPLEQFVIDWEALRIRVQQTGRAHIAIVGGGAAGVELAFAVRYRLAKEIGAKNIKVTLIVGSGEAENHQLGARIQTALAQQQITRVLGYATGCEKGLRLDNSAVLVVDAVIACTGVAAPEWFAQTGLALAPDGFIAVKDGQQSASHPNVFAAGDTASRIDAPHGKSGVYAVRAGPVLTQNLYRFLHQQTLMPYQPQRRSLYLLATGSKTAILSWGSWSAGGTSGSSGTAGSLSALLWRWKDWLDRRFMKQYDHSQS